LRRKTNFPRKRQGRSFYGKAHDAFPQPKTIFAKKRKDGGKNSLVLEGATEKKSSKIHAGQVQQKKRVLEKCCKETS